ncbi:MAG: hypothetical protein QOC60_497, partial [Frankiaceae bacterium]|nr:hypothetical protein [Frankiaceae bacterium]
MSMAALLLAAGGYAAWQVLGKTSKAKPAATPTKSATPPV